MAAEDLVDDIHAVAEHLAKRREAHAVQVGILSELRNEGVVYRAWGSCTRGAAACSAACGANCRVGAGREGGAGWSRRTLMNICVVRLSVPLVANEM